MTLLELAADDEVRELVEEIGDELLEVLDKERKGLIPNHGTKLITLISVAMSGIQAANEGNPDRVREEILHCIELFMFLAGGRMIQIEVHNIPVSQGEA